jgi:hypothetical protein
VPGTIRHTLIDDDTSALFLSHADLGTFPTVGTCRARVGSAAGRREE